MSPYKDEYDHDFDHPACMKYGDSLRTFLIIETDNTNGVWKSRPIGEMEFISREMADRYCAEQSEYGFFTYYALPVESEN